jgi:hypothetical protein
MKDEKVKNFDEFVIYLISSDLTDEEKLKLYIKFVNKKDNNSNRRYRKIFIDQDKFKGKL